MAAGIKVIAQISLTQTAAVLSALPGYNGAVIQADTGNAGTVAVGDSALQLHKLTAGKSVEIYGDTPQNIYVKSSLLTGDKANVILLP